MFNPRLTLTSITLLIRGTNKTENIKDASIKTTLSFYKKGIINLEHGLVMLDSKCPCVFEFYVIVKLVGVHPLHNEVNPSIFVQVREGSDIHVIAV